MINTIFYSLPELSPLASPVIQDRRSVLNFALTCRAFRAPALNVLYSHLNEIGPLIKALPDELVHLREPSPVTPEQFHSLVPYATRVKILSKSYGHDDTAYELLVASAPKDTLLFPKLRSLTWWDCCLTSIPALRLFLSTLESLSLHLSDTSFLKAIIPDLHITAPYLKALAFVGFVETTEDSPSEIESLLLSYSEGLTKFSFTCYDIPSHLLDVIAAWPRLRWLTLELSYESIPPVPLHIPQPFQALNHLHISCDDLGLFMSFLRAFRILRMDSDTCSFGSPNLKTIQINALGCSSANIWSELLILLTRITLEHIIVTDGCRDQHTELHCHIEVSAFEFCSLLTHPTALVDLRTLVLSPNHASSIALNNADILTLARTCPYLEILDLGMSNTSVSLCTLGVLVRRCRELRKVFLCVDARLDSLAITLPNNDDDNDQVCLQPNTRLYTLDIGDSPIACEGPLDPPTAPDLMRSIPRFLHSMAPGLQAIVTTSGMGRAGRYKSECGEYERRWEVVSDALAAMAKDANYKVEGNDMFYFRGLC
ncbi:uncharacterized protein EDB91DRAFT_1344975 [Suillus paluster]|uniref:uncharacterized protein n=1 Tax=Suillus paluster TaxID=48578 RepID=UPI001B879D30|nr:uncharacterized protein EDB91DRAFT_1344975 [Suillus paluster]KAG1748487.1 hypothetical protein EDB91DRAFT_1344975 [Suillus paluster]